MSTRSIKLAATLASLLTVVLAFGQATSSASSDASPAGETIELSPFTVSAERDVGYVASNSLAGSRLDTPLRDTAASITVMTSELLNDLAATNFEEALQYANNVQRDIGETIGQGDDNEPTLSFPTYRVRGIAATTTRNYFKWRLQTDTYNLDRIEESRGPNSILFGIGAAGGVINASTKKALLTRKFVNTSLLIGSYNTRRGSIDANLGTFNDRIAVRFNGIYGESDSWRQFVKNDTRRAHLAATVKITGKTFLRLEGEIGDIDQVAARGTSIWDSITSWDAAGRPIVATPVTAAAELSALGLVNLGTGQRLTYIGNNGLAYNMARQNVSNGDTTSPISSEFADETVNAGGPGQTRTAYFNTYSAFLDHQFGEKTFAQVAFNSQSEYIQAHMAGLGRSENNRLKADPMQFLPDGTPNPYAGQYFIEGDRWTRRRTDVDLRSLRASLSHELELGKMGQLPLRHHGRAHVDRFVCENRIRSVGRRAVQLHRRGKRRQRRVAPPLRPGGQV